MKVLHNIGSDWRVPKTEDEECQGLMGRLNSFTILGRMGNLGNALRCARMADPAIRFLTRLFGSGARGKGLTPARRGG